MTQSKNILRNKDNRSHSCAQLKTDHFSGSVKYKFFSHKELLNKTSKEKIEMMNRVKFNYEDEIEQKFREGTFLIKENKTFTITPEDNPYVKEEKEYTRKRVKVVENWESIEEILEEADLVNLV